jgi:hypothetical protein
MAMELFIDYFPSYKPPFVRDVSLLRFDETGWSLRLACIVLSLQGWCAADSKSVEGET